jgi:hypothetical protein
MLKYFSSINIFSKSLSAEEIENILNVKFDEERKMGYPRSKSILTYSENAWILNSSISPDLPFSAHIESLLEKIEPKIKNFSKIENNCEVECQCIIEGNEEDGSPEINIPPHLIKKLSFINAGIDVDIYIS